MGSNLLCSASASICKQAFVSSSVSYGRIQAITTRQTPPSLHYSQFHPPSICTHKHSTISEISSQLNQLIDAVSFVLLMVKWLHRGGTNNTMPGSSVTFIPWSLISVSTRSTSSGAGFEKSTLECRLREIEDSKNKCVRTICDCTVLKWKRTNKEILEIYISYSAGCPKGNVFLFYMCKQNDYYKTK